MMSRRFIFAIIVCVLLVSAAQAARQEEDDAQKLTNEGFAHLSEAARPRFPAGIPVPRGQEAVAWDPGELAAARAAFEKALARNPAQGAAAGGLCEALAVDRQVLAMAATLDRLTPSTLADGDLASHLERALRDVIVRGEGDAAIEMTEKWLARAPTAPAVRSATLRLLAESGGLDRARSVASSMGHATELDELRGEIEIRGLNPGGAIPLLSAAAVNDRRAAWLAGLAAVVVGAKPEARLTTVLDHPAEGEEGLVALRHLLERKAPAAALEKEARALLEERKTAEAALVVAARSRATARDDIQVLLECDLAKSIRDWNHEATLVAPLVERVRAGGSVAGLKPGDLYFRLGRAQFHSGHPKEALASWRAAGAAGKDDAELHFHYARAYEALGKPDERLAALRRAAAFPAGVQHADKARAVLAKLKAPAKGTGR